jgi:UDP-N-acetylmuramyl pentapeptide phosphotransferase/UDP-N-acetylglucosamine-1-phosphate transferase
MGGVAIFLGFCVAGFICLELLSYRDFKFIFASLFVIFFIGMRDDLVPMQPILKLFGQVLAISIAVVFLDLRFDSLHGLFGIHEIPISISYAATIFTMIIITNSFNLIDGIDGLAGTVSAISLLTLGSWFLLAGEENYTILAYAMLGSIIAFLFYNWHPSEVFMGDTGALVIGMMLSILTVYLLNYNNQLPENNPFHLNAPIASALCFIYIPLLDTSRIIIIRLSKGKSPMTPDKSHIHHTMVRLGLTPRQTCIALGGLQLLLTTGIILLNPLGDLVLISVIIVISILFSLSLDYFIIKRKNTKEPRSNQA